MSERGVFAIDRGLFAHHIFADEPFTEREAWMWMIGEAAWKPRTRRIKKFVVDLKRGELAASVRGLAEVWKWHRSKVERFLGKLKTETMIETLTEAGITVVTICNYEDYQFASMVNETPAETPNRDSSETIEKKDNNSLVVEEVRAPRISPEAAELSDFLARLCGHDPDFIPPSWASAGPHLRCNDFWLPKGWTKDVAGPILKPIISNKRDGPVKSILFLEAIMSNAIAKANQPVNETKYEANGHAKPISRHDQIRAQFERDRAERARLRNLGGGASGTAIPQLQQCKA